MAYKWSGTGEKSGRSQGKVRDFGFDENFGNPVFPLKPGPF